MVIRELLSVLVSFVLGFDEEMVDLIAVEDRRHSKICIQYSLLTKAGFNERVERCDKTGDMFSSLTVNVGGNTSETHSKNPIC
jgi:hypothetical protein